MTSREMEKELQAGKIRPVYYLYGENRLGMDHMLESIRGALYGGASRRSTGEITLYGSEVKADELVVAAKTFPMLSGRRMIMIKAAHEIPKTEMRRLALYMENPADFTCLIFLGDTIRRQGDFFKALQRLDALVEFLPLREKELPRWLQEQARLAGKELSREAAAALVELVGGQMDALKGEIEKLLLYAGERETITVADVQNAAMNLRSFSVFELVDAVGRRDTERSLLILSKMMEAGEESLKILGMIARQVRHIWQVKQMTARGKSAAYIQKELGLQHWLVEKLRGNGRHFSEDDLKDAVYLLARTDMALKSSRLDSRLIMEGLIVDLCRKGR